jgi:hypothetical protein
MAMPDFAMPAICVCESLMQFAAIHDVARAAEEDAVEASLKQRNRSALARNLLKDTSGLGERDAP